LKKGHVPYRTCLGCSGKFPKGELFRFTLGAGGPAGGDGPGRGYYVCRKAGCVEKGLSGRKLLRLSGRAPGEDEIGRLRQAALETGDSGS
jgi:predicted RNA-binding protein YlxR (DUF448 family)